MKIFNEQNKNIIWTFMAKIIAMIFFFLADVVAARVLDITEYGTWIYFYSLKTMISYISYFGINTATKISIARSGDKKQVLNIYNTGFRLRLLVSSIFGILITLNANGFANILDKQNKYPFFKHIFSFMGVFVFCESFIEYFKETSYGLSNYKILFFINSIEYIGYFILTTFLLSFWKNIDGVLFGSILAFAICCVGCLIMIQQKYKMLNHYKIKDRTYYFDIIKIALPLLACEIANMVSLELDTSMIGMISNAEQVAIYNIGKKICSKAGHINLAISAGVMTSFAVIHKGNYKKQMKKLKKYFVLNLVVTLLVATGIFIFGKFGVGIIYGEIYKGAGNVLMWLLVYYIMFGISTYLALFLDFQNLSAFRSVISILCTFLNLVLNYFFIPKYGALGAVWTTLFTQFPYFICVSVMAVKILKQKKKLFLNEA